MAKYARTKLFQFIDNVNPAVGVHSAMTDEPIRCDVWTEPDPVTGLPVEHEWCPLQQDYYEYIQRMAREFAYAAHAAPNQTMLYFVKSPALQAAWDATTAFDKNRIKGKAWNDYDSVWNNAPNAVPAPDEA